MKTGIIIALSIIGILFISNIITYFIAKFRKKQNDEAQQLIGESEANDEKREEIIKTTEEIIKKNEETIIEAKKLKKPDLIKKTEEVIEENTKVLNDAKEYLKKVFPNRFINN